MIIETDVAMKCFSQRANSPGLQTRATLRICVTDAEATMESEELLALLGVYFNVLDWS
jgi:hypothetical protein